MRVNKIAYKYLTKAVAIAKKYLSKARKDIWDNGGINSPEFNLLIALETIQDLLEKDVSKKILIENSL